MISEADIRTLIQVDDEPAVSIYLPVHAALPERQKNAIRFRKLMREAEEGLRAQGAVPERFLEATRRAFEPEPPVEGRETRGLAVFTTGGEPTIRALHGAPPEHVAVRRGFDVLPLLPFVEASGRFFVITLDQASPKLMRGDRTGLATVAEDVMERSLGDIRGSTELDTALGFHSAGRGGSGRGTGYSQASGESAEDYERIELDLYARGVARAVDDRLKSESAPLVPVGEPSLLGMFRKHCRYAGLTETAVAKLPAGLDDDELFRATLAIAEEPLSRPVREATARAVEGHNRGDGTVSVIPAEALEAAEQGRVGTLLLARTPAGAALRVAEPDGENPEERRDLCDRVVRATVLHGGEVMPVGPGDLPEEAPMAALFRF